MPRGEDAIFAIAQYIRSLPAVATSVTKALVRRTLSEAEKEGRAVFFDATRMGSCGACQEEDDWGSLVAKIETVPADAAALRASRVQAGANVYGGFGDVRRVGRFRRSCLRFEFAVAGAKAVESGERSGRVAS